MSRRGEEPLFRQPNQAVGRAPSGMEICRDGQTSLATGASRERGIGVCGRGILVVAAKLIRVEVRFLFFACYVCDRIFVAVLSGFSGGNLSYCCRVIFHRVFKRRSEGRRSARPRFSSLPQDTKTREAATLLGGGGRATSTKASKKPQEDATCNHNVMPITFIYLLPTLG